jgi:hypothetical protein
MKTATAEQILEAELWVSFISLLRSYAAAASLNNGATARVEELDNLVAIVVNEARLQMQFDPETGRVNWRMGSRDNQPITGSLEFLPDGMIAVGGAEKDMDHVAIELVASLMDRDPRRKGTQQ